MDIEAIKGYVEQIVSKVQADPNILAEFKADPTAAIKKLIADVPQDVIDAVVAAVKAKLFGDEVSKKAEDIMGEVSKKAEGVMGEVSEKAEGFAGDAKAHFSDLEKQAGEKLEDVKGEAKGLGEKLEGVFESIKKLF
ncbi:MAG: hypothetical protein RSB18_03835 [Clostridia bacterium]